MTRVTNLFALMATFMDSEGNSGPKMFHGKFGSTTKERQGRKKKKQQRVKAQRRNRK